MSLVVPRLLVAGFAATSLLGATQDVPSSDTPANLSIQKEFMATRPNVIFIMADDMGYGDLSSINGGLSRTPNLDRLHDQSLRFSHAYAASPVCAPSRAGFLTGRYPLRTGCVDLNAINGLNQLALEEVTIADLFKKSGYRTGLIGKWHCGTETPYRPENRGFSEIEAFHPQRKSFWNWSIDRNGTEIESEGRYLTHYITERALDFVDRAQADEPFFLHLAHYAPHRPLEAPQPLIDSYLERNPELTLGQATVYAMIEIMDEGIGQLMEKLDEKGLADNTIVIFTSDNGPDDVVVNGLSPTRFNCGLRGDKYDVYEGGIRVPFLVRWPNGLEAGDFDGMFHFVDVLPTLAAACSVEIPEELALDGVDYLPAWKGDMAAPDVERFWQWNRYYPVADCNIAMRNRDWKLIMPAKDGFRTMSPENEAMVTGKIPFSVVPPVRDRDLGAAGEALLYKVTEDPNETNNLAETHPDTVAAMHERLDTWFREVRGDLDTIVDRRFPESAGE